MFGFPPAQPFTPTRWLADGDTAQVGQQTLTVRHCPGHTPGHKVFHTAGVQRASVGDRTVFIRGHGPESCFGQERRSTPYVRGT